MKAYPLFKLFIDNQAVDLNNLAQSKFNSSWQLSIIKFVTDFSNDDTSINVKTSGSTGKPKQIELLKSRMRNSAEMTGSFLKLKENDKALLCLSADYIAGKMMLVRAMVLGLEIHCYEPKTEMLQKRNQHFAFSAMVPMQAMANLKWLSKIDTLIIGGGTLSQSDTNTLIESKHSGLYQTFGMTETISHVALKLISEKYYTALKDISFSLSQNETLVIDAPNLLDEPISTNDLVHLESNTSFEWLGRVDNVINSGGYKIIPEKVEIEIGRILRKPFFVAGIQDAQFGEKMVLFIEGENSEFKSNQLKELELNKFEIPKEVYFIEEFTRTDTAKIQRKTTVTKFLESV